MGAAQVSQSVVLRSEFQHYNRQRRKADQTGRDDVEDCTFEFLWDTCESYVMEIEEKKRVQETKDSFKMLAKGGGRGKGVPAKGKGKDRGNNETPKKEDGHSRGQNPPKKEKANATPGAGGGAVDKAKCWYHSSKTYLGTAGCTKADKCLFSHDLMTKKEFEAMKKPVSSRPATPAPSPALARKGDKNNKGKGGKQERSRSRSSSLGKGGSKTKVLFCEAFSNLAIDFNGLPPDDGLT